MPIYEYVCSACSHRLDILHGVHDAGPTFCPSCGAEGTMRKAFAPPTIHFKGTGWAKKERRSAAAGSRRSDGGSSDGGSSATESSTGDARKADDGETPKQGSSKPGSSTPAPAAPTGGD